MTQFEASWLAARSVYDEGALDTSIVWAIRSWASAQSTERPLVVVDLGSGTGVALRRAAEWLAPHALDAYAVDSNPELLAAGPAAWVREAGATATLDASPTADVPAGAPSSATAEIMPSAPMPADGAPMDSAMSAAATTRPAPTISDAAGRVPIGQYEVRVEGRQIRVTPLVGDVLAPLGTLGGPVDGSVDLVLGHALADLVPLDRLLARVAALLRPGGLAHLALTYNGETSFAPTDDRALDEQIIAAYHRHMDRRREREPSYGGSTAGTRLEAALRPAGLQLVHAADAVWQVQAADGPGGHTVLERLLRFVVESVRDLDDVPGDELRRWDEERRAALDAGTLAATVRHRDVLARRRGGRV